MFENHQFNRAEPVRPPREEELTPEDLELIKAVLGENEIPNVQTRIIGGKDPNAEVNLHPVQDPENPAAAVPQWGGPLSAKETNDGQLNQRPTIH